MHTTSLFPQQEFISVTRPL